MPARTNAFQQVVALIEESLAPQGAIVSESAELPAAIIGELREIDVLIQHASSTRRLRVAVEAKDERRKLTLPVFESYMAKYQGPFRVDVDEFVVVTRRGFYKSVEKVAKILNVELLTLKEATRKDWGIRTNRSRRAVWRSNPLISGCQISPLLPKDIAIEVLGKGKLFCPHGRDLGKLLDFAKEKFEREWLPNNREMLEQLEREVAEKHNGDSNARFVLPLANGYSFRHLEKSFPVAHIELFVRIQCHSGPISMTTYERSSSLGEKRIFHHIQSLVKGLQSDHILPFIQVRSNGANSLKDHASICDEFRAGVVSKLRLAKTGKLPKSTLAGKRHSSKRKDRK